MPESRAAADEILRVIGYSADEDTLIEISRFYQASKANGGSEPVPVPAPELISVT
jgi:hypothetical protein